MGYFDRFSKGAYQGKNFLGKLWYFIWHEDSIESWIINIILAYFLIKFAVYPGLGLALGTSHPIVAVVSDSMHHGMGFDDYWGNAGKWYEDHGISQDEFRQFSMHNGFNKGDIMILLGRPIDKIDLGDIIVFQAKRADPIIHRVVVKHSVSVQTKGDNFRTNPDSINTPSLNELDIKEEQIIGKAFIRVPFLGYIKIWAVDFACVFKDFNFCIRR